MVDCASNERTWVVTGVPQISVLGTLLLSLCTYGVLDLVENRLFAYADDDSTLFDVARLPADRPNVATFINRYMVWIHEWWCSRWCMLMNHAYSNTKDLVVNWSKTVNSQPWLSLVWYVFPYWQTLTLISSVWSSTASPTLRLTCLVLCQVSHR